jgi:polyhydroxybutyrate depolymerase
VHKRPKIVTLAYALLVSSILAICFDGCAQTTAIQPGNTDRTIEVDGLQRTYRIHIPKSYDAAKPTPVVLAFHGATDNIDFFEAHCHLDDKSESAGFVVVYPEVADPSTPDTLHFNTSSPPAGRDFPDDVAFTSKLLDDLATVVHVDPDRIFATGMSNGGMMCYRLAAELSDRIAAIAPVAGTMGLPKAHPTRPVPIMHFHGTADPVLPFENPIDSDDEANQTTIRCAMDTIDIWVDIDGCPQKPVRERLPILVHDGTSVTKETYAPGKDGAEVILFAIKNGGHTWPGTPGYKADLGLASQNVSANNEMWAFFEKHPMRK